MPHFEELPTTAKKSFPGAKTPPSPTDTKTAPSIAITTTVFQTANLLGSLEVRDTKNVENNENLDSLNLSYDDDDDKDEDEAGDSSSDNDEGYESEKLGSQENTPKTTPAQTFNIKHSLNTDPKTQHFAKTLTVFALHPVSSLEAGQIIARYINLPLLKSSLKPSKARGAAKTKAKVNSNSKANFYTIIEDLNTCNSDGLAMAKALFCPKGKLLLKHQSSPIQYLGPWGLELESSAVLVIKYLCVDKSFRRQGIARLLLNSLVSEVKQRTAKAKSENAKVKFVLVFPAVIEGDFVAELEGRSGEEREEIEGREYANAVGVYQALGFRRIGVSEWFGLAIEEEHASRRVVVEDDLDPEERDGN